MELLSLLLLHVLLVLLVITVNRSIWLVRLVAARRSQRFGGHARINRVVRRECAHLDEEYRRLMRR